MQTKLMLAAATLAAAFTTSAYAAKPPPAAASTPPPACANTNVVLNALDCSGFYAGNLVKGAVSAEEKAALLDLTPSLATNIGDAYITKLDALGGTLDLTFTGYQFYGLTYFGIHFGAAKGATPAGPGQDATGFYVVDFGDTGGNTLHLNVGGSSNVAVYSTKDKPFEVPGVPEPATWAMMIIGFGGVGAMVRRRRETLGAV